MVLSAVCVQANKCNILAAQHDAEPAVGSKLLRLPAIQQMWAPVSGQLCASDTA